MKLKREKINLISLQFELVTAAVAGKLPLRRPLNQSAVKRM